MGGTPGVHALLDQWRCARLSRNVMLQAKTEIVLSARRMVALWAMVTRL